MTDEGNNPAKLPGDELSTPKTFEDVFKKMTMTPEEEAQLEAETFEQADFKKAREDEAEGDKSPLEKKADDPGDPDAIPGWVTFPPQFKMPAGKSIAFMQFRAAWTDRPEKGDRQCILWPLSDADEKLALKRTRGESARTLSELAKQMIKAIDGVKADWTGKAGPGNVERFWDEVGSKCRQQIQNFYLKTHSLTAEEQADFFLSCLCVRTSVAG
jgi:hypothetical protein